MRAFIIAIILALFPSISTVAQTQYSVAIKQQEVCKLTDGSGWKLEIGEVFPFIRFVSRSELTGGQPDQNDHEFSLLQIDDKMLLAPSSCLQAVPESQIAVAAMNYKKLVDQYRQVLSANTAASSAQSMQQAAQAMQIINSMQESSNRQLQQQMDLLNSMGSRKGGGSVNSNRSDRAKMEQTLFNAGLARSLYVARQMSDDELARLYPQALQIIELKQLNNRPLR